MYIVQLGTRIFSSHHVTRGPDNVARLPSRGVNFGPSYSFPDKSFQVTTFSFKIIKSHETSIHVFPRHYQTSTTVVEFFLHYEKRGRLVFLKEKIVDGQTQGFGDISWRFYFTTYKISCYTVGTSGSVL